MRVERSFPRDPSSVRDARRFVAEQLAASDDETRERVVLLVSELVSNAVRHADTGFLVAVAPGGSGVLVEVSDGGPGEPSVQPRDPTALSGRGLQLVEDLADTWGVRRNDSTKTVWFRI